MIELLRGVGGLMVATLVFLNVTNPVSALGIAVLAVIGWLTVYDKLYSEEGKE